VDKPKPRQLGNMGRMFYMQNCWIK